MKEIPIITIETDEKFLRQISKPVNQEDQDLEEDMKKLEEYCKNNEVMALASIQIGIPKRIIYLKNTNLELIQKKQENKWTKEDKKYNEAHILINPVVKEKIGLTEYWEACASCLDYMGLVKRPYEVVVEYLDRTGKKCQEKFTGFPATVVCHELNHLDGVLHMDVAEEVVKMPVEERKIFRQTHDYTIIEKTGNFDEWM